MKPDLRAPLISEECVAVEIERLHAFIAGWFRGEYAHEAFEQGFVGALHPEFTRIPQSGKIIARETLIDAIGEAHGASPEFQITIDEVKLLAQYRDTLLATYIERQTGAQNSPLRNTRRSTVLFQTGFRLIWRHVHETEFG